MWPFSAFRPRREFQPGQGLPSGPVPPPHGHPERLIPNVPATSVEAKLWRQLQKPDEIPAWVRFLEELRWIAGIGGFLIIPGPPDDDDE